MHSKIPEIVTVLGVVSNGGHVTLPHLFEKERQIIFPLISRFKKIVKPCIDSVCGDGCYIFEQESALGHKTMITQD